MLESRKSEREQLEKVGKVKQKSGRTQKKWAWLTRLVILATPTFFKPRSLKKVTILYLILSRIYSPEKTV